MSQWVSSPADLKMHCRITSDFGPEGFDSRDKSLEIARPQMVVAITGSLVGRMTGRSVDLGLGNTVCREKSVDRVAQRVRRANPDHLRPAPNFLELAARREPDRLPGRVGCLTAQTEFRMGFSRKHETFLE